jgi:hypothetical protein
MFSPNFEKLPLGDHYAAELSQSRLCFGSQPFSGDIYPFLRLPCVPGALLDHVEGTFWSVAT